MITLKQQCNLYYLIGTLQGISVAVECIKGIDTMVLAAHIADCSDRLEEITKDLSKDA